MMIMVLMKKQLMIVNATKNDLKKALDDDENLQLNIS